MYLCYLTGLKKVVFIKKTKKSTLPFCFVPSYINLSAIAANNNQSNQTYKSLCSTFKDKVYDVGPHCKKKKKKENKKAIHEVIVQLAAMAN